MSDPYIGEIRMFGGNYAPLGWMFCNGQTLAISEYEALYGLIGTTYGGDGQSTFRLPDLQGRLPIHRSPSYPLGQSAGVESVSLTVAQIPAHTHMLIGSGAESETANPQNGMFATSADTPIYAPYNPSKGASLNAQVVGSSGGSQPHNNMMPSLCVSFIIATEGIYPSQG